MDILSQLIHGMTRNLLPQGHTHGASTPDQALAEGRVDVILSHAIAGQVSGAHPVVQALFAGSRSVIDGALTAIAGPVAIEGMMGYAPRKAKRVSTKSTKGTKKKSTEVSKRNPGARSAKQYTDKGIEIIDAEFVDIPSGGGR